MSTASPRLEPVTNAMTVDVEDYFQVAAFEQCIRREDWPRWPVRVEGNTRRVLELFERHGVHATFFVLGWVAERFPALVRDISAAGHEVASHGFGHERLTNLSRAEFRDSITRTKGLLEDATGTAVHGYRAPSYSIGPTTLWATRNCAKPVTATAPASCRSIMTCTACPRHRDSRSLRSAPACSKFR